MCMSCGCGKPNDAQGDQRNITMGDIDRAAESAGISRQEVIQNMRDSLQQASSMGQGQNQSARGNNPEMRR